MLAERRSPTRYVMQGSLCAWEAWAAKAEPQFLKDLKTHPPSMILDSSPSYGPEWGMAVPPIDIATNPWASSPSVSAAWASVFDYLHQHYPSVGRVDFAPYWGVYVPR